MSREGKIRSWFFFVDNNSFAFVRDIFFSLRPYWLQNKTKQKTKQTNKNKLNKQTNKQIKQTNWKKKERRRRKKKPTHTHTFVLASNKRLYDALRKNAYRSTPLYVAR